MCSSFAPRLFAVLVALMAATTLRAQGAPFLDSPASRQRLFKDLVVARSRAIDAAFPGFLATVELKLAIVPRRGCPEGAAQLACYDATQNVLSFDRRVLGAIDHRLLAVVDAYWPFYEQARLRAEFPVIGLIDGALWSAFMSEIAEQHDVTWPHEGCGSIQMAKRLGCEMLVSGVDSHLRFRQSRIYNANRRDRLWPDDLTSLERSGGRDREYAEVRDLGGTELLRPLIEEFGVARVFAYVAQTPFMIEGGDVRASALRYQERARSALEW